MKKHIMSLLIIICLAFTSLGADFSLTWDPPTNNIDNTPVTDLIGYRLYQGILSSNYATSNWVTGVVAHVYGITNTTYFAVTAVNSQSNESDWSSELKWLLPVIPMPPSGGTSSYNFKSGLMTATWTKPTKNADGTTITSPVGYILFYGKVSGGPYTHSTNLAFSLTTVKISIPTNSGYWYHTMITSNALGFTSTNSVEWSSGTTIIKSPTKLGFLQ